MEMSWLKNKKKEMLYFLYTCVYASKLLPAIIVIAIIFIECLICPRHWNRCFILFSLILLKTLLSHFPNLGPTLTCPSTNASMDSVQILPTLAVFFNTLIN